MALFIAASARLRAEMSRRYAVKSGSPPTGMRVTASSANISEPSARRAGTSMRSRRFAVSVSGASGTSVRKGWPINAARS